MAVADHMQRLSEEHIHELREKHGRIKHVVFNGHDIVFRKPQRKEVLMHASKIENPSEKSGADELLAQLLVVYPTRQEFNALVDEWPYMTRSAEVGGALAKLTGLVQDEEAKS